MNYFEWCHTYSLVPFFAVVKIEVLLTIYLFCAIHMFASILFVKILKNNIKKFFEKYFLSINDR